MRGHRSAAGLALLTLAAGVIALLVVPSSSPAEPRAERRRTRTTTSTTSTIPSTTTSTTSTTPEVVAEPVIEPAVAPRKLLLIGDSMAFTAGLGLAPYAADHGFVIANEGINGCGVVRGGPYRYFGQQRDMEQRCEDWPTAWQDALARNHPVDVVAIQVGRWELMDRVHDGRWTNLFDPAFAAYVEQELDAAVAIAGSTGAKVAVFTTPYYRRGVPPGGGLYPEDDPARTDAMNAILRRVAERHRVALIDVGGRLSPEGTYTRDVEGIRVRSDGVHLTREAGAVLAPFVLPRLDAYLKAPDPPARVA